MIDGLLNYRGKLLPYCFEATIDADGDFRFTFLFTLVGFVNKAKPGKTAGYAIQVAVDGDGNTYFPPGIRGQGCLTQPGNLNCDPTYNKFVKELDWFIVDEGLLPIRGLLGS